jgi:hypothetical protein
VQEKIYQKFKKKNLETPKDKRRRKVIKSTYKMSRKGKEKGKIKNKCEKIKMRILIIRNMERKR